jgi:AcrR family transcriptional regulator
VWAGPVGTKPSMLCRIGCTTGCSRRRQGAARTRTAILDAARELFTERGYAATPMSAIAERAGVALDTVYASAGRKPELAGC